MDKFVLIDPYRALVSEKADVSEYMTESIRNIYGISLSADFEKYEGIGIRQTVTSLLRENGLDDDEINTKLDRYMEDLQYSYNNVMGGGALLISPGSKEFLETLKQEGVILGIATGEARSITDARLKKAGLGKLFDFEMCGDSILDLGEIIDMAIRTAHTDFDIGDTKGAVMASSPAVMRASRDKYLFKVGVPGIHSASDLKRAGADIILNGFNDSSGIIRLLNK